MNPERFEELLVRYWDDSLDERGWTELQEALTAQPELRAAFNDFGLHALAISERFGAEKAGQPQVRLHSPEPVQRRRLIAWVAAAVILAGVGLTLLEWGSFSGPGEANGSPVGRLGDAVGTVYVSEAGKEDRPVGIDQVLIPGQTISTVGVNSSAEIRCPDGKRLLLGGNTSVGLPAKGSERFVLQGDLAAEVPLQAKNRPLQIYTPKAEVLIRDAKVSLASSKLQTLVGRPEPAGTAQGTVQVKRHSDGQSVSIRPGEWAVAYAEGDMQPEVFSPVPDFFRVVFGRELPSRWGKGKLVFDDLPLDSQAAVRAEPHRTPKGVIFHKVQTQNEWTNGLFSIYDDSWLHVRFRVEKPGFFHTLIVTRDPDPTRRLCLVLEAPHYFQHRKPNEWYTAHLPFAKFRPTQAGIHPDKPLIAFIVLFDSQKADLGLTIERFWVTRGPEETP